MSVLKQMKGLVKHLGREERTDASLHVSKLEWLIDRAEAADTAQAVIDELVGALENAKAEIISNIDPNTETFLTLNDIDKALKSAEKWRTRK